MKKAWSHKVLITLSLVALTALTFVQILWIKKTLDYKYEIFTERVMYALNEVTEEIQESMQDTDDDYPIYKTDNGVYVVIVHDTLNQDYLGNVIHSTFMNHEIPFDFEYHLYDCFNESIVYSGSKTFSIKESVEESESMPHIDWESIKGHYFSVYFPNIRFALFKDSNFVISSSLFLLINLAFFIYLINIIKRQKDHSDITRDFINNMTHEFKTPISTISLSANVIKQDGIVNQPERLKTYAGIIENENNRLKSQVDRILQMAIIEQENFKMNCDSVNLKQLIQASADSFKLKLNELDGKLDYQPEEKDVFINADVIHLTAIFNNLIDNAIKYSGDNVEINISLRTKGNQAIVSIADKGIGIKNDDLRNIFDKFYRVTDGNIHDVKGFGIGLNYVKLVTEKMNGKINVNSTFGESTTFTLTFPIQK